ncbi:MAG: hypothetical protein ABI700_16440 [Chloroflexota bacterium]
MHYETFLFTRNQRQDFTAFVRPSLLTNKEVNRIGAIFNYITDISRITPDFPSLYCFPLGEYLLLLRHYSSERKHAGRAIGVIEGIAVRQTESEFMVALSRFVEQQATLLNVAATIADIETQESETSAEHEWNGSPSSKTLEPFVGAFLTRREQDRLFLPFTTAGRDLLVTTLADRRFPAPPYFAFGTNSDVLVQLDKQGQIDIVSFFKTDRASFRNRRTNSVSGSIDGNEDDTTPDPSMALRSALQDERNLRSHAPFKTRDGEDEELNEETIAGSDSMSIRSFKKQNPNIASLKFEVDGDHDDENDSTILTMRQVRDRIRAEEAAAKQSQTAAGQPARDPIHWLLNLVSSLISPKNPK